VREKPSPFVLIGLPQPVLHRDVPTLAADYGHVVIDGPPRNYEVTRSAIAAADLVLIPVQPSGADFWARRETVKLAEEARARGRGLPVPGWFWIRRHRRLAWDRCRPIISLNYARSARLAAPSSEPAPLGYGAGGNLGCALGTPGTGLSQRAIPHRAFQIRPTESCPN
jgi:hypothetical protein